MFKPKKSEFDLLFHIPKSRSLELSLDVLSVFAVLTQTYVTTLCLVGSPVINQKHISHPQMARTAEMRTEGGWLSWRPLTVAWRNC